MPGTGRHRVLLGMAPGVGKTYRMLQEGRAEAAEGHDVVIGYLEPHDRPETAAQAEGLEMVPRSQFEVGSTVLPEMDLEAVLNRAPEIALVDELAHTNARGSRNEKRYQDVLELLGAGISVISTVNVQHLESLNDQLADLTGVRVRETLPDDILKRADEIVLIDLTPEDLIERLREGRIYPRQQVEQALNSFFKTENLAALREVALRQVAEDVESRRLITRPAAPRRGQPEPAGNLAFSENMLALITPDPDSQRLIRRAWRSARRLGANLDLLWVAPPSEHAPETDPRLVPLRRLASVLGCDLLVESGDDLVQSVREVARERGTTYILLGPPDRSSRTRTVARVADRPAARGASRGRYPGRQRPLEDGTMNRELLLILALTAAIALIVFLLLARVRSRQTEAGSGETLLFPFDLSTFSNDALERSIRIARGSGATLLPAYLAVVPLRVSLEAPLPRHAERAIPMIDRIELAASSQGVRVDSSIESGRTLQARVDPGDRSPATGPDADRCGQPWPGGLQPG